MSQFAPHVEVWQRNDEEPENPKAWHLRSSGPEDRVVLASLGIELTMEEIYQDLLENEESEEG